MNARATAGWLRSARTVCLAFILVLATVLLPSFARAVTCDPSHFPGLDNVTMLNKIVLAQNVTTMRVTQGGTFWAGMGVLAFDGAADYDVKLHPSCLNGTVLAASQNFAGRTDFVLGDFNNNPTGQVTTDVYCFSGTCTDNGLHAASTWRSGSFLFVDFPATTIDFSGGPPYSPDRIMHVWDVFLTAGNTYYFQFSSTLGNGSKLALFRNAAGGVYWTARSSAEFETGGCITYTAPASGYYGLVEVNDVWADGSYTVGVTTAAVCACAAEIPAGTPVALPLSLLSDRQYLEQIRPFWTAVGVRPAAGSDWDLETSTGSVGAAGCPNIALANSVLGAGSTDVTVTDFNFGPLPEALSLHPFRFVGPGGATLEWDGDGLTTLLSANGPQEVQSWGPSDVLMCRDTKLEAGKTYTFYFFPTSNIKLLLFRNPSNSAEYSTGRTGAVLEASGTATFTAPSSGFYGVVVVKDDDLPGTFSLRLGTCTPPAAMVAGATENFQSAFYEYRTIAPSGGRWTAVGARSSGADWDVLQFGNGGSDAWPNCFAPEVARSEAVLTPDFIVGDFHHNAPGVYPLRFRQFSSGSRQPAEFEWTGNASVLAVNGPVVNATPLAAEVLRCYEAYLSAGITYQIEYNQVASRPLLVFGNPGGTDYWAGRGAALLSTTGPTTYTPVTSGDFAFVIANDSYEAGSFSLRISSVSPLGVGDGPERFATSFAGAQPNPAHSDVLLRYSLAHSARVRFELLDASGRRAWSHDEGVREAGEWSVTLPRAAAGGARLPAGLYFARIEVDGHVLQSRRMTLLD